MRHVESEAEGRVDAGVTLGLSSPLSDDQFREMYPALRRFAGVVASPGIEADDLIQDAVVGYLRRFDGAAGVEYPLAYLRTAILGLASNHRRGLGRRQRREHAELGSHHVESYPSHLAALLAHTSPRERALLLLVDVDGESVAEAAGVVGISPVAARAVLSRSRRRLRRELEGDVT